MASATSEQLVEVAAAADVAARAESVNTDNAADGQGRPCLDGADGTGAADDLNAEQVSNARIIIDTTAAYPLPQRAAVIAVATAMQESSLRNVNHGDQAGPDSRGLFQQRLRFYAAEGDPMDPVRATEMFLVRLIEVDRWDTRPLTQAAQAVQISAHPTLYARHETLATDLVAQYWGVPCDQSQDGPEATGGYAPPLAAHWYSNNPGWFTKPHHDYPSADIPVPTGTDTYAVIAGVAQHVGGACGLGIAIDGEDGHRYIYCHHSTRTIADGARVAPGQKIGEVGNTGRSFGPHLHFDIRIDGAHRCPQPALVAWYEGRTIDPATLPRTGCTY